MHWPAMVSKTISRLLDLPLWYFRLPIFYFLTLPRAFHLRVSNIKTNRTTHCCQVFRCSLPIWPRLILSLSRYVFCASCSYFTNSLSAYFSKMLAYSPIRHWAISVSLSSCRLIEVSLYRFVMLMRLHLNQPELNLLMLHNTRTIIIWVQFVGLQN